MPRLSLVDPRTSRVSNLANLLRLVDIVPAEIVAEEQRLIKERNRIRPLECRSWSEVQAAWAGALHWGQRLEDILVAALAVAISTQQQGEQVFLQIVGPPGSGKSKLVSALMVSDHCYAFENFSGLFSGWRSGFGDEDYSMMARVNGKTLITPEGDIIVNSPSFSRDMSHLRRMYDGQITQDYKTMKEQRRYDNLRCPIVMAGTPKMMRKMSQPQLGDRFLRILADKPTRQEERNIVMRAISDARNSVRVLSNGTADSTMSAEMTKAYRLTGGYVDHMREKSVEMIGAVDRSPGVDSSIYDLAQFTSMLRCKPQRNKWDDEEDSNAKEMPTRLGQQLGRVADCAAALMSRPSVDAGVMRLVRKIAIDTADAKMYGTCCDIYRCHGDGGAFTSTLARWSGVTDNVMADRIQYLREIGTVKAVNATDAPGSDSYARWQLSDEMLDVWYSVRAA